MMKWIVSELRVLYQNLKRNEHVVFLKLRGFVLFCFGEKRIFDFFYLEFN